MGPKWVLFAVAMMLLCGCGLSWFSQKTVCYGLTIPTTNLQLWLKADDMNGNRSGFCNEGWSDRAEISLWADSSGKGNHGIGGGSKRPLWIPRAMNGLPVVRFDGVDDYISVAHSPSIDVISSHSVCTVFSSGQTGNRVFLEKAANTKLLLQPDQGGLRFYYLHNNAIRAPESVRAAILNSTPHVVCAVYDSPSSTKSLYLDGVLQHSGGGIADPAGNGSDLAIGSRNGSVPMTMDLAEFILYDTSLSTTDLATVQCGLGAKYAIPVTGC
jgi:hypothetical protein